MQTVSGTKKKKRLLVRSKSGCGYDDVKTINPLWEQYNKRVKSTDLYRRNSSLSMWDAPHKTHRGWKSGAAWLDGADGASAGAAGFDLCRFIWACPLLLMWKLNQGPGDQWYTPAARIYTLISYIFKFLFKYISGFQSESLKILGDVHEYLTVDWGKWFLSP